MSDLVEDLKRLVDIKTGIDFDEVPYYLRRVAELERRNEILGESADRRGEAIVELEQELTESITESTDTARRNIKLRKENQRLREALEAIADDVEEWEMAGVAITALEGRDE